MAAKKLTITDPTGTIPGLSINVRYEKMDREDPPSVVHKVGDLEVKNRAIYGDIILLEGMTRKGWVSEDGKEYPKDEVKHYFEGEEIIEKSITKTFEIQGYSPLSSYTDSYIISKYYEIFPDEDGRTKDFERDIARRKNLVGMRTLWEYLHKNGVVARSSFNASSAGFTESDAYLRAISFGHRWVLELSVFDQVKEFQHLQENVQPILEEKVLVKRIKRV